jgi:methyl-accepting chemotaxis protein
MNQNFFRRPMVRFIASIFLPIRKSLQLQFLLVFLALSLIPLVALGGSVYAQAKAMVYASMKEEMQKVAEMEANRVEALFIARSSDTRVFAADERIRSLNPDKALTAINGYAKSWPGYQGIVLTGASGKSIATNTGKVIEQAQNPSFIKAMQGNLNVSAPFISKMTGDLIIAVFAPVLGEDEQPKASVSLSFPTADMSTLLADAWLGESGDAYLVQADGLAITPSRFTDQMKNDGLIKERFELEARLEGTGVQAALKGELVSGEYTNFSGHPVIGAYAPVADLGWVVVVEQDQAEALANISRLRLLVFGVGLAAAALAALLAVIFTRRITAPLNSMADAAQNVGRGDLNRDIPIEIKRGIANRMDEVGLIGKGIVGIEVYLLEMAEIARRIADGDLSIDLKPRSEKDELGQALSKMIVNLREQMGKVTQSIDMLDTSSQSLTETAEQAGKATAQIATTIQDVARGLTKQTESVSSTVGASDSMAQAIDGVARGAKEQSSAVEQAARLTGHISNVIQQVSANAQSAAQGAKEAAQSARSGGVTIKETVSGMQEIKAKVSLSVEKVQEMGRRSDQIGAIVEVIDDIASQTNLLALNAAIEAARAGEHGKGFAVVADEVRKLAEKSAGATREIGTLIREIQTTVTEAVSAMDAGASEVETGVRRANQSGEALNNILQAVEAVNRQVEEIATAAQKMSASSNELVGAMNSVSTVVEENTAVTEQMAASSGQVTEAVENIASISEENSAAVEEVSAGAEEMTAQVEEVASSARSLAEMSATLRSIVSTFRLNKSHSAVEQSQLVKDLSEAIASGARQPKDGEMALNGKSLIRN